jgi:hypothetical protein
LIWNAHTNHPYGVKTSKRSVEVRSYRVNAHHIEMANSGVPPTARYLEMSGKEEV